MKTNNELKTEQKKEPKNKYVIFPITITEWNNNDISSYTIQKSYKDKDGNWNNTESFTEADLCIISKILSKI